MPNDSTDYYGDIQNRVEKMKRYFSFRWVRTEEGKRLRRAYEAHELHHGYLDFKMPEIKKDGCANAITSVQKDNLVIEVIYDR